MIESRAQTRAHVRLIAENREHFRRIYANAAGRTRGDRRSQAIMRLTHEYPKRYREIYNEEKEAVLAEGGDQRSIDLNLVGKASGPGPFHAVLANGSATLCGRVRFHTYPASTARPVDCSYCTDLLREKSDRAPDPKFSEDATAARARVREFADLQARTAEARASALEALGALHTPPKGTAERTTFAEVLNEALGSGLTLREIGKPMSLSGERIRQIVADA